MSLARVKEIELSKIAQGHITKGKRKGTWKIKYTARKFDPSWFCIPCLDLLRVLVVVVARLKDLSQVAIATNARLLDLSQVTLRTSATLLDVQASRAQLCGNTAVNGQMILTPRVKGMRNSIFETNWRTKIKRNPEKYFQNPFRNSGGNKSYGSLWFLWFR